MKNLKDYLHLYLGGLVYDKDFKKVFKLSEVYASGMIHYEMGKMSAGMMWDKVLLVLRPLSDITEDEKVEIVRDITYNHVKFSSRESILASWDEEEYANKIQHMRFYADEVKYLLSKNFDLFGLIEAELAINKTSL